MSPPVSRPPHLTAEGIALAGVGGALGTGSRYLLASALPTWAGVPVATLGINVVGAFLLGALLTRLARPGAPAVATRRVRLLAGTGFLGGFTTYSALSSDTALLLSTHPGRAVAYAVATVVVGAGATVLGVRAGQGRAGPGTARVGPR